MSSNPTSRRVAFSEAFSKAFEDTDRHSPLYRFMVEHHDAIAEKRSRYGSWDKFLELVNEAGIRDGQDRPVTVRVLYRTWERVTRAVKASRTRPAARVSTPVAPPRPGQAAQDQPTRPQAAPTPAPAPASPPTLPMTASIVTRPGKPPMIVTKKWQAHLSPLAQEPLPPGKSANLSYEEAWGVQTTRNGIFIDEQQTPFATLQQDLVNDLTDEGFAVYIGRFDADVTGERVLEHIAERKRIMDELKKGENYGPQRARS